MAQGIKKGPKMIHEIRRLKGIGLSQVKISMALGVSRNTVRKYLAEIKRDNSEAPLPYIAQWAELIDWSEVYNSTLKGVALAHFHEEYIVAKHPNIPYVSFWREYKRRYPQIPIQYHKVYSPGLRCEVDFKGDANGLGYKDPVTGDYISCRLFGAILCFSQLFFACATHSEKQGDWLESISQSYRYFGGVPLTTATDNARALVSRAHRYDPDLNPEFTYFAEHFATAPLAMRPGEPKDKNLIECTLGVFWRWVRARIRSKVFWSLGELNRFLETQLSIFNQRQQRKYGTSRQQKFLAAEQEKLLPLPDHPYYSGEWRTVKVHPDCHIQIQSNFYSVPWRHIGTELTARISSGFIEVYSGMERIALHCRLSPTSRGRYVTKSTDLPPIHHELNKTTPEYLLTKAESIGPATTVVVKRLFTESPHPLMHLRRVQGLLRLAQRYSNEQLEKSCVFFKDRNFAELRLSNMEVMIKNPPNPIQPKKIIRNQNINLRGQSHWSPNNPS